LHVLNLIKILIHPQVSDQMPTTSTFIPLIGWSVNLEDY
jgi:hypothetical protein